ncbi:MAG: hypothetical protein P3A28_01860 [Gemmatimonadota bacterium]|nr:hypothetical protein [Gemmatimonadota bacterium]
MINKNILKLGFLAAVVAVLARTDSASAQGSPTPTEKIADCVDGAWESYKSCVADEPFWMLWPCGWKFEADVILCLPKGITKVT